MSRQKTLNLRTTVGGQELFARVAEYASDGTHIASSLVPATQNMEGNVLFDTGNGYAWSSDVIESHVFHVPNPSGLEIDGRTYRTVKIGNREWMAENLASDVAGGVWYDNDESHDADGYGKLYNYAEVAALDVNGWHVPEANTDAMELMLLSYYYDGIPHGARLMSQTGWTAGGGTNELGFDAVGAGGSISSPPEFSGAGNMAIFAATNSSDPGAFANLVLGYLAPGYPPIFSWGAASGADARVSVRLVKDYDGEDGVPDEPVVIDGKTYSTVRFGDDVWLAENLAMGDFGHWYYDSQESYGSYGKLYSHDELSRINVDGWHLPTLEEMVNVMSRANFSMAKIKSVSGWTEGVPGDGTFGFNAMPAGQYVIGDNFYGMGVRALFTGAPTVIDGITCFASMDIEYDHMYCTFSVDSQTSTSVRLVKNRS